MRALVPLLTAFLGLPACVLDNGGAADAAVYDVPDAAPYPGFRDAGCGGGGTSGTSGTTLSAWTSGTSGASCGGDAGGPGPRVDAAIPDAGTPDATPCDYVTFRFTSATAASVWVTGDWTSWADSPANGAWQMTRAGDEWTRAGQIGAGRHPYKLIIDGTDWIADPGASEFEDDGFGGQNSVITVCN